MAQDKLNYRITADASGFVKGANQAARAAKGVSGNTKKSSLAFTQLAYAMDDAQYGFRGVQNNLQAMAVQMGIGGPWIIAITGATIALNYLIENTDLFSMATGRANKESQKFIDTLAEELGLIDKLADTQEEGLDQIKENHKRIEAINKIEQKQIRNGKQLQSVFAEERAELEKKNETIAYLLGLQSARADADKKEKENTEKKTAAAKKYNEELKKIKDSQNIKGFASEAGLGFKDPGLHDVFDIQGSDFGLLPDPEVIAEEVDDINDLLRELGSPLAELSPKLAEQFLAIDDALLTTAEKSQMFAGAFIGAFDSAASQGGNLLENLARGLMSSLGSILIQQGTAAIFSGIAKNAIIPGSGSASISMGAKVVAAGVVMKAGGNVGRGAGGSGGGFYYWKVSR